MSDIPPRASTKQNRKIARKAKIALVRKQQIASYLSRQSSSIPVSRELPTQSRVHFCVSHSVVTHGQSQSTSCGIRPILRGSDSYRSSTSLVSGSSRTLLPMNWATRCLHQSSDIHLIPVGIPLVQTPYGLAVQSPARGNSIAYLRKGDLIVQQPDSL